MITEPTPINMHGMKIHNDPRAIKLHGIPHRIQPAEAANQLLASFRYYQRRVPGLVGILRDLQLVQDTIEDVRCEIVSDMRADGLSWAEVGDALGMTRQGARQRFGGRGIA